MTNEQRTALTDLQEKIIQNKLQNADTSWVETDEEMNDLKQAIIRESMNISENNNIVHITDYSNKKHFMIFNDGFVSEKKIDYSSVNKTDKIHKITGIMIFGWFILLFVFMGIFAWIETDFNINIPLTSGSIYFCIICGIINIIIFRLTE